MRAKEEAYRALESALSVASQSGAAAEVALCGGTLGSVRFTESGLTQSDESSIESMTVRLLDDGHVVQVSTSDLSPAGIQEAVNDARERLDDLGPSSDREAGFPEAQHYPVIDAFDPDAEAAQILERAAMAARAVMTAKSRGMTVRGFAAVRRGGIALDGSVSPYAVANTRGLLAYHPETRVSFGVQLSAGPGRFGDARLESFAADAVDADALVAEALEALESTDGERHVASGVYRAILMPSAVGQLLRFLGLTCGAGLTEAGASFLSDRVGQTVCSERVTIRDDFAHPLHRGIPFDIEGVARKRVELIRDGVAKGPVFTWENARRLEAEATGHHQSETVVGEYEGARHLVMEGEGSTQEELLEVVGDGVVIPGLERLRLVDSQAIRVTGVSTGGVRVVEGGALVASGPPMRMECGLIELLCGVLGTGTPVWSVGGIVPAIAVEHLPLRSTRAF